MIMISVQQLIENSGNINLHKVLKIVESPENIDTEISLEACENKRKERRY